MTDFLPHLGTITLAFFAIMNPIANTPIFIALTDDLDASTRVSIAIRSLALAFAIIAVFSFGGQALFHAFGITLPALKLAGGVLVGLVGYNLLHGEPSVIHTPDSAKSGNPSESSLGIAITPLALPILAGPGTIATAMSFAGGTGLPGILAVVTSFAIVCAITLVCFLSGPKLVHFLGRSAIKVITRLMGLILAVIGAQMLIDGVGGAVTAFQVVGVAR